MATRFYFPHTYASTLTPSSWSAGWNKTTGVAANGYLTVSRVADVDTISTVNNAASGTSGHFTATRRYISGPLAAQTISGTVKGQVRCSETATGDNYTLAVAIKVIQSDGSDRGALLAVSASDNTAATPPEMATTLVNRSFNDTSENASITLSSVAASANDRLVVEVGFRQASTSVNNAGLALGTFGSNADCGENNTDSGTQVAWIEFSNTIQLIDYYNSSSNPADSASATNTADPTGVVPPSGMIAGDLAVMVGQQRATGATLAVSATGGQTWNSLTAIGATNQTVRVFWCTFNGTWSADPSVDFSATTCNSVQLHAFRPPTTSYTWSVNVAQTELDFASDTTPTITGQTTVNSAPTVTLVGWFTPDDNTWGSISGTGWQDDPNKQQFRNTSGSDQSAAYAWKFQVAAGATGDVTKTQLTLGADDGTSFIVSFAASLNTARDPGKGDLALSTTAPTVQVAVGAIDLSPARANLVLSTAAPTLFRETFITPATANLALSTTVPTATQDIRRDPASVNLTLSTTAPDRVIDVRRDPASANLALSTTAPTLFREFFFTPATANLALSTAAPSVIVDVRRDPASADLLLSATAPTLFRETFISPATVNLALSTTAPDRVTDVRRDPASANLALSTTVPAVDVTTTSDTNLSPATSNLVLSTTAPSLVVDVRRDPASANLALSTTAPTLFRETFISPATANLALSTVAPSVLVDVRRDPASANLLLSTTAPALAQTTTVSASPATANLTLTTTAPTVTSAATGEYIPAAADLVLSTTAPAVVTDFRFTPATANLALSTVAPSRVTDVRRDPASANLSLTTTAPTVAQTASLNLSPDAAQLVLSPSRPELINTVPTEGIERNPWWLRWQLLRAQQEQQRDRLVAGALIEIVISLLPGEATGASRATKAGVESIVDLIAGSADSEAPAGGRALRSKLEIRAGLPYGEARFVPAAKLDRCFEVLPGLVAAHKSVGGTSMAVDFHLRH